MKNKITAQDILEVLGKEPCRERLVFLELRLGAGYGGISERRIDAFTIETAPSKGHRTTAYEIKISRGDFRNDLKNPKKQRGARLFCDNFYYVTPPGLVTIDEVPVWAGLIEINPDAENWRDKEKIIVVAPQLDKERPTWGLLIAAARNLSKWSLAETMGRKTDKLQRENRDLKDKLWRLERDLEYWKGKAAGKG